MTTTQHTTDVNEPQHIIVPEPEEYPCQQLMGGAGPAIYSNTDGLCSHPECNPENDDRKRV